MILKNSKNANFEQLSKVYKKIDLPKVYHCSIEVYGNICFYSTVIP